MCDCAGKALPLIGGDAKVAYLADGHAEAALVPSGDDAADSGLVGEGLLSGILLAEPSTHSFRVTRLKTTDSYAVT